MSRADLRRADHRLPRALVATCPAGARTTLAHGLTGKVDGSLLLFAAYAVLSVDRVPRANRSDPTGRPPPVRPPRPAGRIRPRASPPGSRDLDESLRPRRGRLPRRRSRPRHRRRLLALPRPVRLPPQRLLSGLLRLRLLRLRLRLLELRVRQLRLRRSGRILRLQRRPDLLRPGRPELLRADGPQLCRPGRPELLRPLRLPLIGKLDGSPSHSAYEQPAGRTAPRSVRPAPLFPRLQAPRAGDGRCRRERQRAPRRRRAGPSEHRRQRRPRRRADRRGRFLPAAERGREGDLHRRLPSEGGLGRHVPDRRTSHAPVRELFSEVPQNPLPSTPLPLPPSHLLPCQHVTFPNTLRDCT